MVGASNAPVLRSCERAIREFRPSSRQLLLSKVPLTGFRVRHYLYLARESLLVERNPGTLP